MEKRNKIFLVEVDYPSEKHRILSPKVKGRHKCLYGGRGGAKSWTAAIMAIHAAQKSKCRILCTREIQLSIAESMYKLIKELIIDNGLNNEFEVLEKGIRNRYTGSEFIFKGMQDIKSLEGVDIAIVEEAQQVSKANAERLIPTIRRDGSEIWWLWNPENEDDWVNQYFLESTPPNTVIQKVNFSDNKFCPQVLKDEADYLKESDYEEYRHIWLGELKPTEKGWRFINPKWLDYAASGEAKPLASPRLMSRCAIGSDPAFHGTDDWVTITGKGNKVLEICSVKESDTTIIAANLNSRVISCGRFNCDLGVDCIGTGTGVGDMLEKIYHLGDCLCRCNHKDKDFVPPLPKGTEGFALGKYSYDCWRSQAWHLLRCDLEAGNIDLSEIAKNYPAEFKLLKKEIRAHDMQASKTGKMQVTPKEVLRKKEILGWSPGRADALVAWNWVRKRVDDIPRPKSDVERKLEKNLPEHLFL